MDLKTDRRKTDRLYTVCDNVAASITFLVALTAYWLTADHSASYWDCPEYATCASMLEIGHPPGNPIWMLAMKFATIPFPKDMHPLIISLSSGLFMALASFLLAKIIFFAVSMTAFRYARRKISDSKVSGKHLSDRRIIPFVAATAAIGGGLCFALCDSAWFSAVESEVYAMSTFITALMVWLMTRWYAADSAAREYRILILIAYLTGLSLGVHQLNLLCIPALALIYSFKRSGNRSGTNPDDGSGANHTFLKGLIAILASFVIIILILIGMMNGVLTWAADFELFAVNRLGLPYFSGTIAYLVVLTATFLAAVLTPGRLPKHLSLPFILLFVWLSGIFVFKNSLPLAFLLSLAATCIAALPRIWNPVKVTIPLWMTAVVILGYSSFALILIRGHAAPPMNEAPPTDIFSLASYISRDQYGSKPLFYGATPFSRPMLEESFPGPDSVPAYSRYVLKRGKPKFVPLYDSPRFSYRSRMLSHEDSAENARIADECRRGYILSDYTFSRVTTPELDMWLPRITGNSSSYLESYQSWVGMTKQNMTAVEVSETFDPDGMPAGRLNSDGKRVKVVSYRPTYLQNLSFFLSYQVGYMYFRYLLWNFMGRQNDIPSTGEIDHGNFITGIPALDNLMLGDQSLMPSDASSDNPGRNVYFGIPLILGIIGIIFLLRSGKTGKRICSVVLLLFLLTGMAIVVYLNQTPGEPRERDYSFIGSYMAFAIWIAFGMAALALWLYRTAQRRHIRQWVATAATTVITLLPPAFMGYVNFDDHDRSGRSEPYDFASNILLNEQPSIIFTHGDNFTFPLWFAQEVMETGVQHTVIDASYFAMPDYVVNLMKQGKRGIRLTAHPSDILYGAYNYTRIAADADTVPIPAIDALKEMYADRSGEPTILHRFVTLPGKTRDEVMTIDMRRLANGSSLLPFKKLMLLDLIATNLSEKSPRRICFLSSMPTEFYHEFESATRRMPYMLVYDPDASDSTYLPTLRKAAAIPIERDYGEKTVYSDPVIADQRRRQRGELIIAARNMIEAGDTTGGIRLAIDAERLHPYSEISPASFTVADTTFHEGMEFAELMLSCARMLEDPSYAETASRLIDRMLAEAYQWRKFYASLPKVRRHTVSNSSRRLISIIPRLEELEKKSLNINKSLNK